MALYSRSSSTCFSKLRPQASRIISAALERTVQNMEAQSRELAAEREAGERALR